MNQIFITRLIKLIATNYALDEQELIHIYDDYGSIDKILKMIENKEIKSK